MIAKYTHNFHSKIFLYIAMLLCLPPASAFAAERPRVALPGASPPTLECVVDAARTSDLPLAALLGVLATEGGTPGEALRNTNGTWDLGPFQLNTCHVGELAEMGIAPDILLRDGCVNAYAAAWLLRKEYNRTGDIWEAVSAYHSRTPKYRDAYIARVKGKLIRLRRDGIASLLPQAGEVTP